MKIVMIGEAASHQDELAAELDRPAEFIALPPTASDDPSFDPQIEGADILVTMRLQRPAGKAPRVNLLHIPGAGLDRIDFKSLHPDTVVCNAFEHEIPLAEYALLSMLQHEIQPNALRAAFDSEHWSQAYRSRIPHGELHSKTVGIVGFGRIGQMIATRARAFGMHVIATDNRYYPGKESLPADQLMPPAQLAELLPVVDYLILACPLNNQTRGLIGTEAFSRMKPTSVLINIARGPVVDENALYQALSTHQIDSAYLDVWYQYPIDASDVVPPSRYRFEALPNAICSPHAAAWTWGLFKRRYAAIAHNINRLYQGVPLQNVVHGDASALQARVSAHTPANAAQEITQ